MGSTWSSQGGDAPKPIKISLLLAVAIGRETPEPASGFGRDRQGRWTWTGGEQKGRALTCSWRWAARGTQAASSRGTAPRSPGPAGPAGPAPSGRVRGVGAGLPATSCALQGCRLRGSGPGSGSGAQLPLRFLAPRLRTGRSAVPQ